MWSRALVVVVMVGALLNVRRRTCCANAAAEGTDADDVRWLQQLRAATSGWYGAIENCSIGWNQTLGAPLNCDRALGTTSWSHVGCDAAGRVSRVTLWGCHLSGTIPELVNGAMSQLRNLNLGSNQLYGPIPSTFGSSLVNVERLMLHNNQLEGVLHMIFGNISSSIQILWLYNNKLNGSLPSSWSTLPALHELLLSTNRLSGSLPEVWSNLTKLQELLLDVNQFTGSLPPSWAALSDLKNVTVAYNNLVGDLPLEWVSGMHSLVDGGLSVALNCLNFSRARRDPTEWSWWVKKSGAAVGAWTANLFSMQRTDCLPLSSPAMTVSMATDGDLVRGYRGRQSATRSSPTTATLAVAAAMVPSPTALGAALQRSLFLVKFLSQGCGTALDEPLDRASSPLQVGFGPERAFYVRGSIVGNLVLLVACALLAVVVVVVRHLVIGSSRSKRWRRWSSAARRLQRHAAALQLPGHLQTPLTFLIQPIIGSCVTCVMVRAADFDVVVGTVGLVVVGGSTLWFSWILCDPHRFHAVASPVPRQRRRWWSAAVDWMTLETCKWRNVRSPASPSAAPSSFVEQYGPLFDGYQGQRHWYWCVEVALSACFGVLSGLQPVTAPESTECRTLLVLLLVGNAMTAVLLVVLRPHNRGMDLIVSLLSNIVGTVAALLSVIGNDDDDDSDASVVAEAQLYMQLGQLALTVVEKAYSCCRRCCSSEWIHSRWRASEITTSITTTPTIAASNNNNNNCCSGIGSNVILAAENSQSCSESRSRWKKRQTDINRGHHEAAGTDCVDASKSSSLADVLTQQQFHGPASLLWNHMEPAITDNVDLSDEAHVSDSHTTLEALLRLICVGGSSLLPRTNRACLP